MNQSEQALQQVYNYWKDKHREACEAFEETKRYMVKCTKQGVGIMDMAEEFANVERLKSLKYIADDTGQRMKRAKKALFAFRAKNAGQQQHEHDSKSALSKRAQEALSQEEQRKLVLEQLQSIHV